MRHDVASGVVLCPCPNEPMVISTVDGLLARLGKAQADVLRGRRGPDPAVERELRDAGLLARADKAEDGRIQFGYAAKFLRRGLSVQVQGGPDTVEACLQALSSLVPDAAHEPWTVTLLLTAPWSSELPDTLDRLMTASPGLRIRTVVTADGLPHLAPALRHVSEVLLELPAGPGSSWSEMASCLTTSFPGMRRLSVRPTAAFAPAWRGTLAALGEGPYEVTLVHEYGPTALPAADRLRWRMEAATYGVATGNTVTGLQDRPYACPAADPYALVLGADGRVSKCAADPAGSVVGRIADGELQIDWPEQARWAVAGQVTQGDPACASCPLVPKCFGEACPRESLATGRRICPAEDRHQLPSELEPCTAAEAEAEPTQPWFPHCHP